MKEYLSPTCTLLWTEEEDIIVTSPVATADLLNLDDPGSSTYGILPWSKI